MGKKRMKNLLQYVCKKNNGQVFITDTHRERLEAALAEFDKQVQIIQLNWRLEVFFIDDILYLNN